MLKQLLNAVPLVPILRGPARGCLWVPRTSDHGVWLGRYERENVALLCELVRPGMTVWDVGANVGQMTLVMSRLVGPRGRVLAIEPGSKNARALRRHASQCRNVTVLEAAVSSHEGCGTFTGDGSSTGHLDETGSFRVRTTTLDSLAGENAPDLIKLDVEGAELEALTGAERLLAERSPILVIEFHGAGLRANPPRDLDGECREVMAGHGYRSTGPAQRGGWVVFRAGRELGPSMSEGTAGRAAP